MKQSMTLRDLRSELSDSGIDGWKFSSSGYCRYNTKKSFGLSLFVELRGTPDELYSAITALENETP